MFRTRRTLRPPPVEPRGFASGQAGNSTRSPRPDSLGHVHVLSLRRLERTTGSSPPRARGGPVNVSRNALGSSPVARLTDHAFIPPPDGSLTRFGPLPE